MKLRKFRIWNSAGKPEDIESSGISFKRTKTGLHVKFDGIKTARTGVVALLEVTEPEKPIHEPQPIIDDE